jgi:hypothetical protein
MKKTIGTIVLALAFAPLGYAATEEKETIGDKVHETKEDAVKAKRSAGREIRQAGREVKAEGRKARQAVITRCGDGRHTVKGKAGCEGHGGVVDPK